jgi:capsular polysaccharide biosynthesis protein
MSLAKTRIIILDSGTNIAARLPKTLELAEVIFIDDIHEIHKYPDVDVFISALVLSHSDTKELCSEIINEIASLFQISVFIEPSCYNKSYLNDLHLQSVHSLFSVNSSMDVLNIDFVADNSASRGVYKVEHFASNVAFDSNAHWVVSANSPKNWFPPGRGDKQHHVFERPVFEWGAFVCHKFNAPDVDLSRDLTLVEMKTNCFRPQASGVTIDKVRSPTEIGHTVYTTPHDPERILNGRALAAARALWGVGDYVNPNLQAKILQWNSYLESKPRIISVSELPKCIVGGSGAIFSDGFFVRGTDHLARYLLGSILDPVFHGMMRRHPTPHIRGVAVMGFNLLYANYYHWVAETMSSISLSIDLLKDRNLDKITLITGTLNSFRRQFLDILFKDDPRIEVIELAHDEFITADSVIYCDNLAPSAGQPELLLECAPFIEKVRRKAHLAPVQPFRLLYVSRLDTKARVVLNEASLIERLKLLGFEIFVATGKSVVEQIRIFNEAKLIVAPHGAGLTNVLFSQPGSILLELKQSSYFSTSMMKLAQIAGVRYFSEVFFPSGEENSDRSWSVDVDRVEKTIEKLLVSERLVGN